MTDVRLIHGSALHIPLDDESVQCVVTSPPYWGLRQYAGEQREVWGGEPGCAHEWGAAIRIDKRGTQIGKAVTVDARESARGNECACGAWYGALGLEPTPEMYVDHIVAIFREVRRVLRKDGTLWLNLGDSYAAQGGSREYGSSDGANGRGPAVGGIRRPPPDLKPKDLVGIPWMVAFALRADGWYLRSDIIWHKPNPMPESVTDRPTKSHEYLFLLAKSERYYYDADAIRESFADERMGGSGTKSLRYSEESGRNGDSGLGPPPPFTGRNKRTVWTIATRPYKGAHFATFPPDLVEPCVLAGSSPKACGVCGAPWERVMERQGGKSVAGPKSTEKREQGLVTAFSGYDDGSTAPTFVTLGWRATCDHDDDSGSCVVLDPFNGSGTTGQVAVRLGRSYVGVDISKEYLDEQAGRRIYDVQMEAAL